jgi:hypothetical protein
MTMMLPEKKKKTTTMVMMMMMMMMMDGRLLYPSRSDLRGAAEDQRYEGAMGSL